MRVYRSNQHGAALLWRKMIRTIVEDRYLHKFIRKEIGDYNITSDDDFYNMLESREIVTKRGSSLIRLMRKRLDSFSTATYRCDKYYKLKGPSTRRCYYGCWDGDVPTCERKTLVLTICCNSSLSCMYAGHSLYILYSCQMR